MYSLLTVLFPDSPEPALQVAECLLMLGREGEAVDELDRVLYYISQSDGEYESLRPRAHVLRELARRRSA